MKRVFLTILDGVKWFFTFFGAWIFFGFIGTIIGFYVREGFGMRSSLPIVCTMVVLVILVLSSYQEKQWRKKMNEQKKY